MIRTICFVSFGTRGDVQPLATLAAHVACIQVKSVIVTHAAHAAWLTPKPWQHLELALVDSPPARGWPGEDQTLAGSGEDPTARQRQQTLQAVKDAQPSLIVFNLFALEAYSIAEALHVPCIATSPYLIPYRSASYQECTIKMVICSALCVPPSHMRP